MRRFHQRFTSTDFPGTRIRQLLPDDPRMVQKVPYYSNSRIGPVRDGEPVIKSGAYSRKLHGVTLKGSNYPMPIGAVTLAERTHCPSSCPVMGVCTGNKMNYARRFIVDDRLYQALHRDCELWTLRHREGWRLRLHVLGDFTSTEYVAFWRTMLAKFPPMRIYGFTAWDRFTEIGQAIASVTDEFGWRRFAIRWSNSTGPRSAKVINEVPMTGRIGEYVVCPAKMHWADSCASCGLCWTTETPIAFPLS